MHDPPALAGDLARYGVAAIVVLAAVAGLAATSAHPTPPEAASEVDSAIMIDLPPADASSQPPGTDGPDQQATPATMAPEAQAVPPADQPPPPAAATAPAASEPDAVVSQKVETEPPKPVTEQQAPHTQAARSGADVGAKTDADNSTDTDPRASARIITIWQKALMRRIDVAKRSFGHAAHGIGSVTIAFVIDDQGRLVSEHVARTSGSARLDAAAMTLVTRAAPFPSPPPGAAARDLSFLLPVVFKK